MDNEKKISKIYELLRGISDDVNDIKEHLGLRTSLRTADQRFIHLQGVINNMIVMGRTLEAIEEDLYSGAYFWELLAIREELDKEEEEIKDLLTGHAKEMIVEYKKNPTILDKNRKIIRGNIQWILKALKGKCVFRTLVPTNSGILSPPIPVTCPQ
jgi:hypothetical protein